MGQTWARLTRTTLISVSKLERYRSLPSSTVTEWRRLFHDSCWYVGACWCSHPWSHILMSRNPSLHADHVFFMDTRNHIFLDGSRLITCLILERYAFVQKSASSMLFSCSTFAVNESILGIIFSFASRWFGHLRWSFNLDPAASSARVQPWFETNERKAGRTRTLDSFLMSW